MPSTSSTYVQRVEVYGCMTIDAATVLSGKQANTAAKGLAKDTDLGLLHKVPYIHPRCLWLPKGCYFGVQKLTLLSQLLYRCVLAEPRIWVPARREGPATIIRCVDEQEALFVDYGATPRFVARKLGRWCSEHDTSGIAALGVVVPTSAKADAINRAAADTPLPVRFIVSEDLLRLTCGA